MKIQNLARRTGQAGVVIALLACLAPSVRADDSWTAKWSNGHKIESADKSFKLKFGGRIQADYTFASVDEDLSDKGNGFEFRRSRLFFSGTIYERVEFKAQYDFAGGDAEFKDVWIGLKNDWGSVRFGQYKEYFSLEELTSSKYLAFLERSLPVEAFAPSRNSGVGVHGKNGDTLNWGVGAFYDADGFGVSTDEDNFNYTGRVSWRPIFEDGGETMLHIGIAASMKDRESSIRFRARPEAHFANRYVDTGNFDADGATLLGAEFAGVFGPMWFAAEYIQTDVDAPTVNDPTFSGYYAQFGYYLTGEHRRYKSSDGTFDRQEPSDSLGRDGGSGAWEIAVRYSNLDLTDAEINGGEQTDLTVGLNWYVNPATRMMVNYVLADVDSAGDADFVLWRWQVDF